MEQSVLSGCGAKTKDTDTSNAGETAETKVEQIALKVFLYRIF